MGPLRWFLLTIDSLGNRLYSYADQLQERRRGLVGGIIIDEKGRGGGRGLRSKGYLWTGLQTN